MSAAVATASIELVLRYVNLMETAQSSGDEPSGCDVAHLRWMCQTMIQQGGSWPIDKLSRWLGFVQGVLTMRGLICVDEEREVSRPLFHEAYQADGRALPPSVAP